MVSIAALQNLPFLLQYMCRAIYHKTLLSNIKVLNYSHNSPEYCPCPLVPRNSACSVAVHCCGCRGPSVLRGPVEPLEEPVPELWPPGEGNDGLLYGKHPSSKNTHIGTERHTLSLNFYYCSVTHLASDAWRQRTLCNHHPTLLTSAEWPCQRAMPGRATERTLSFAHGLAATTLTMRVNTITGGLLAAVAPPAAGQHNIDPQ